MQLVQTFAVALKNVPAPQVVQSVFALLRGPFVQVHSLVVEFQKKFVVRQAVQNVALTHVLQPLGQALHVDPDKN
jgi:hypothetical protein